MSRPHIKISLLSSIFISILSILVMSHNAGAIDLINSVYLIRGNMSYNFASPANLSQGCEISNYNTFLGNPNRDLACYARSVTLEFPSERYEVGDYITFPLYVFNNQDSNSSDATLQSLAINTNGWDLVSVDVSQLSGSIGVANITIRNYIAGTYTTFTLTSITGNAFANLQYGEYLASGKATHWRTVNGVNYSSDIQAVVNAINSKDYSNAINNINNSINNINDDVETSTQDAADAAQDTADSSQEDNDATGTSLLGVFTSVIGVIINSQETTCTFDSHLPFMSGAGTIDLCMFDPPAVVQTISSLLALALFVPFGLHMYKRFISITRSFQR